MDNNDAQKLVLQKIEQADKEARESKELLMAAIETLEDGFVVYDANDRLVLCNKKYKEIYKDSADLIYPGASFEEIIRKGAERGQYADAIGRVEEWVHERMTAHLAANTTIEQQTGDGKWLRIAERKLKNGSIVGFRVDITNYKNAEKALIEARDNLEKHVEERTAELKNVNLDLKSEITRREQTEAKLVQKNSYLSALHEISIAMFRRTNLPELLQVILTTVSDLTQIEDCFLHIYDEKENILEMKATHGKYKPLIGTKLRPGEGFAGRVLEFGEIKIVDDYSTWPNRLPDPRFDFAKMMIGT